MLHLATHALPPRDKGESHRAATTLELMYDLASVIAIAAAAAGLHHAVAEGHAADGIVGFLCSFFIIWWAWLNYTWFASAYDDGSTEFRLLSMLIMFGALIVAAGIPEVFKGNPIYLAVFGYVVMRAGMVLLWLAAARGDPARRVTALRYARGIGIMQIYWVAVNLIWGGAGLTTLMPLFLAGVVGELAVPVLAERHRATPWPRHHIIERYGLLNIIVLGECFLAITAMFRLHEGSYMPDWHLMIFATLAAIITFGMWGVYFTDEDHLDTDFLPRALLWGYGHSVLFASGAAVGAGFAVVLEVFEHQAHIDERTAMIAIAIPLATYLAMLWLIRDLFCLRGWAKWFLLASAILVLVSGFFLPLPLECMAIITATAALLRRGLACYRVAPR
ncbi:low temperature requirement protein A [Tropicimonas sp.]|uniref:low temperature requirement protein A n=1 Tax=Tropicimonas sp. TaxID=2067044 RepID=UPI003A8C424F